MRFAKPDPSEMQPGSVVAHRFEIEAALGRGAFARVYRARDRETGEAVALKVLSWRRPAFDDALARFEREVKLASRLVHPNIARIVASGLVEERTPYLAMELIDGVSLDTVLEHQPVWDVADVAALTGDLCTAIEHAWSHGIVHRDVKAANVMVRDGAPSRYVLLDFGVAVQPEGTRVTSPRQIVGTPASFAPEQLEGTGLDHRTDLYALGVLMYRLLAGRAPFSGGRLSELARAILEGNPVPPSRVAGNGSSMMDAVVAKAMALRPRDRFQSAASLSEAARLAASAPRVARLSRRPDRGSGEITRPT